MNYHPIEIEKRNREAQNYPLTKPRRWGIVNLMQENLGLLVKLSAPVLVLWAQFNVPLMSLRMLAILIVAGILYLLGTCIEDGYHTKRERGLL